MKNKLEIVLKEKEDISLCFQKSKEDFEKHERFCKGKGTSTIMDKNEFQSLKDRMNTLDSTLKMCAFNIKKLDTMFPKVKSKGNTFHLHTPSMITMHITITHLFMAKCTIVHIVTAKVN